MTVKTLPTPSDSRRLFFWNAQRGRCHLRLVVDCYSVDGYMDFGKNTGNPRRASWDHIKPKSSGGKDARNVLLACSACNTARGSRSAPNGSAERAVQLWEQWAAHCALTCEPPEKAKRKKGEKAMQPFRLNEKGVRVWP